MDITERIIIKNIKNYDIWSDINPKCLKLEFQFSPFFYYIFEYFGNFSTFLIWFEPKVLDKSAKVSFAKKMTSLDKAFCRPSVVF